MKKKKRLRDLKKAPVRYKRVIVSRSGGPEVLRVIEEDVLEPGPGAARVRILAAGVSYADLLMREGVHPEARRTPFTPGWDLVGVVDRLGEGISTVKVGQMVAALPVWGGYAEFICLPQAELVPVPAGLDAGEAVSLVMNYVTAYQMIHRSAHVESGQRALIHAAAGGIGTALLQLGQLIDLEMYGTAPERKQATVSNLGCIPIDYERDDFVKEILRLTGDGVDVVFDGIGGFHLWRSLKALRTGGKVVAYGLTSTLHNGRLSGGLRSRLRGLAIIGLSFIAAFFLPGRKRMLLYSIQRLKRRRPAWFREDLTTLLGLLREGKIKPIIAERIPLIEARRAHELLGRGSISGKIILLCGS
jgi:NADPH2:quinone reductase